MLRTPWLSAVVLLGGLLPHGPCLAAESPAQIKSGDKVVTTVRARVAQGEKAETTLTFLNPGTELTAARVTPDWVEVAVEQAGQQAKGWILVSQLAKADRNETPRKDYPRELAMRSLPAYRIASPDIVQIEMPTLVPRSPYRARHYDVLKIQVANVLVDQPIDGCFMIEAEGTINLGPAYGTVRVLGMTLDEVKMTVRHKLAELVNNPEVAVQLARIDGMQPVSGAYLVSPDGTVNLRKYGAVHVAGKTPTEVRLALQEHLAAFFDSPEVTVEVIAYNSHVYYVIIEATGLENKVVRLPITGNETVLDAVSHVGGLSQLASKKIWIARPVPPGSAETVLPVDWQAISHHGATATNFQIYPGDRVVIADEGTKSP
ncbi:MAG: polysaccharide biosynthesis/export family protein [Thermoguttaceae bacterium]